jgi:hypothetical protein
MHFLILILSLLVPTIFGSGILFLIFHNLEPSNSSEGNKIANHSVSWAIKVILSFALGAGTITFLMFWWGLTNLSIWFFIVFITTATIIILFIIVFKKINKVYGIKLFSHNHQPKTDKLKIHLSKLSFFEIILVFVIIFEIFFVFAAAILRPEINFDSMACWAFKAKVFFYQPQSEIFINKISHANYPLHTPLLMAWSYFWLGEVDDAVVKLIFAVYFLALIGFVYLKLRELISRKISLIFTVFLSTMPLVNFHGFVAYADLPLSFYFTLATIYLFGYFNKKEKRDLILAGLFSGLAVWTKNEGLMLAEVLMIIFVVFLALNNQSIKQKFKSFLPYLFYFLLFSLPWLLFKFYFGLGFSNILSGGGVKINQFHPEIFKPFLEQIFLYSSFHLWPGIFILLIIIYWKKIFQNNNLYLLLIILGAVAAYLCLYLFTANYQYVLDETIVDRNFLAIIPISVFLAGLLFKEEDLQE